MRRGDCRGAPPWEPPRPRCCPRLRGPASWAPWQKPGQKAAAVQHRGPQRALRTLLRSPHGRDLQRLQPSMLLGPPAAAAAPRRRRQKLQGGTRARRPRSRAADPSPGPGYSSLAAAPPIASHRESGTGCCCHVPSFSCALGSSWYVMKLVASGFTMA